MKDVSYEQAAEAIKDKIKSLADEYTIIPDVIGDDEQIMELGILDSPGVLALLGWFEDYFDVTLAPEDVTLENLGTVRSMVAFAQGSLEG